MILGVQEALTNLRHEDVALRELLVQRRDAGDAGLVRCHGRRWTTVDDLEWSSPRRRLVRRVVAELGPGQPPEPAARAISCQAMKIDPKDPICYLRLAIRLGVESGAEMQLDASQLEELRLERAGEDGVAVADDGARDAV